MAIRRILSTPVIATLCVAAAVSCGESSPNNADATAAANGTGTTAPGTASGTEGGTSTGTTSSTGTPSTVNSTTGTGTTGSGTGTTVTGTVSGTDGATSTGTTTGAGVTGTGGATSTGGDPTTGGGGVGTTGGGGTGGVVNGITVQTAQTRQNIQGFGINSALMPGGKSFPINDLFGTSGPNAIGLSILRVGMNTDGSLTGQGVSEAKGMGAKIIGSTWSPPGNCKSDGTTDNGGYLLESCYESWATTIANFAQQQGLYAMSIANESDFASCPGNPVCTDAYDTTTFTAKQMVAWVKVAGAKLKAAGIKVIAPEASEWIHAWSNLSGTGSLVSSHPDSSDPHGCGCFANEITPEAEQGCAQKCLDGDGYDYGHWLWKDQEAWGSFDIFGVHEYDSQIAFAWPDDVNGGVRDKEVWQTEMSGVMHWPEQGPSTDIANGVAVAGWIHSALTVGEASAWLYWWYEAYYQNDNEGLALTQGSSTIAKRYYALGNYSKFIRPGYMMVNVAGNTNADLQISAAKSEDGATVVVVAINKGAAPVEESITISGGTATSCTPNVTSSSDNLVAGTAVPVTDGVFSASLGATSITTFVCQ